MRNRGGRRRGTTTRPTRTRAATEAVTMSTDATVTLAPTDVSDAVSRGMAAAAAQQAALQQLNSNSPGESQVKLKLVNFYGNLLSMRVLPIQ